MYVVNSGALAEIATAEPPAEVSNGGQGKLMGVRPHTALSSATFPKYP
jgi:hypothetical protein